MRIIRSRRATDDLDAIWLYIAQHDVAAADRLIDRITGAIDTLRVYPDRGTPRFHLREGARSLTVGRYFIFYVVLGRTVRIVRILHSARDIRSLDV